MVHKNDRRGEHENDTLLKCQGSCIQTEIENADVIQAYIDILKKDIGNINDCDLPSLLKKYFNVELTLDEIQEILYGEIIIEEFVARDVYFLIP